MLVLAGILAAPALAFEPRAGDTVLVSESVDDDLYATGGTVEVTGTVNGDVVAAGGTLRLSGPATGSVLAAGGRIRIGGRVGRTVRAARGSVTVSGPVGTDAVVAGGSVEVERTAAVGRDLVAAGGNVLVDGTVDRNALLSGGRVVIGGTIRGDARVTADRLVVASTGRILGRLRYSTDQPPEIQPGAQVAASERVPVARRRPRLMLPGPRLPFAGRLLEWVWLLVLGIVLLAVAPVAGRRAVERVGRHFPWSLLVGFLLLVAVPAAAVLAMITIIGIPLGIALLLLYLATLYPAQVIPATWLGDRLLGALTRARPSPYLALLVGTLLLVILVALPFVGWLVRLLALLVGFGALWASVWIGRRPTPGMPLS